MAVLLATALAIFNVDILRDWFRGYVDVVAVVTETSGVRIGSPVMVEGVEAGHVIAVDVVELGERGAVAFHVRLHDRGRSVVREGSLASTRRRQFVGEPMVRISAGAPGARPVESGDTLYPDRQLSPDSLLAGAKALVPALDSLAIALAEIQRLASARSPHLVRLAGRLAVATEEAGILRSDLGQGSLGQWLRDPSLGRRIDQLRERLASVSETTAQLRRFGDPEMRRGVAAVDQRAERLMSALQELERQLATGDGMLGRMQRDSAIAVAIAGVQAQIDSLRAEGLGFALRMFRP